MKLKCLNKAVKRIGVLGHHAVFIDGVADVSQETGEALVAAYPDALVVVTPKKKAKATSRTIKKEE